jgi:hypothetical protein
MNPSLSWFDDETLRKLLSGAGTHVRSRHGTRGRTLITVSSSVVPSTLQGQFGHTDRFAVHAEVSLGRFRPPAVTKPGPPDPAPPAFDPKATRVAAGTSPPPVGTSPPPDESAPSTADTFADAPPWVAALAPSVLQPPRGSTLEEKAQSYLDWAMRVCNARAAMIADGDGLPLAIRAPDAARASLGELGAVTAAMERSWVHMEADALAPPVGHAVLERDDDLAVVTWAAGVGGRRYAILHAEALPAQAAIMLAATTFRSLFGGGT